MPEAITRWWDGPLRTAAIALGAVLACAAPAGAATTTYPAGAGTFDADAQGWTASDARCAMTGGVSVLCSASGLHDPATGNPAGALATRIDVTVNVLGLFSGSGVWTSPTFDVPADADVTGAALAFDAAFAAGGLLNLGVTTELDVTLSDLTDAGTTPVASVSLDDRDAAFAVQGGALPDGAIEAGHRYRLVFTTTTTSSIASAGLLGRSSTAFDNVELDVTTADPTPPGGRDDDRRAGDGDGSGGGGGDGTGGTGGGGGSGGTGGAGGTGGTGGSTTAATTATAMTSSAFSRLLRSLDLTAQTGPLAGGSLVPRASCTIVGTPRADRLVGTRGIDVICGLGGKDVIRGGGASDLVDGGAGRDRVVGGAGGDVLLGLAGADRLLGGGGRDVLAGGAGRDRMLGGPAVDRLLGGAGRAASRGGLRSDRASSVERRLR